MRLLARILFGLARIGDTLRLHRLPLRARDAAIRCLRWNDVCRKVTAR